MLKKILIGLGVVIVLLIAAVVIIPAFVPVDTYKEQLTAQVKTATGRDLVINGAVDLSVFPTLGIQVEDVAFSNAAGAKQPQMATLSRMVVALKLLPLLSGGIEVDKFVLVDPVIHLEVDKRGNPNWQFDGMAAQPATQEGDQPKDDGAGSGAAGDGALPIQQISLGEVGIQNGTVTYVDGKSGQEVVLSKINMNLDLPSIEDPLVADGRVTWNNEEVALQLRVENPRKLIEGDKSALDMKVDSKPVKLAFNGSLTNSQPMSAGGAVDLDVPSVRDLAAWTGNPLEFAGSGFGPLKVKGDLGLAGPKVSFSKAQITFDQINGNGEMAVDAGGAVPYVMAKLAVDKLDLNPYLPPPSSSGAASGSGGDASGGAGGGTPAGGTSKGWSNDPIDASALRTVDADLSFSSGEILMQKIKIDRGAVAVKLRGGKLTLDLTDLQLYGGKGVGQVNLDASGKSLAIKESFKLAGIQARPLLTDAADTDWLEGAGGFELNVTGRGNSQRQIVSSLNGNGDFKFLNGAIHGINIAEIMRRVGSGDITAVFDPSSLGDAQKTDFAELSGTYVIRNGILTNNDMQMLSPLLRITGAGTVSMPPKTLDYRIEPKLVGSLQGQGGAQDLKGLAIPMNIRGPWDNFQVEPDFAAMFSSNPKALLDTLSKGGLKVPDLPGLTGTGATESPEKAVEGLIKGVLGGGDAKKTAPSGQGDAGQKPKDPIESLKKLFD